MQVRSTDGVTLPLRTPRSPSSQAPSDVAMDQEEEGKAAEAEGMDDVQSTEPARPATIEPTVNHKQEQTARQVGQMIMIQFPGYEVPRDVRMLIEKYFIGGVLLSRANIYDARQVAALTFELQKTAKDAGYQYPLLIGIDQENGMFSTFGDGLRGTHFPGAMTIAATRSPNEAFNVGRATAKELAAVGINWVYGPSLDLVHERDGSGVSVRSFGDHPETVSRFGTAFIEGLKNGGVIACGKHFPGANTGITRNGRRYEAFQNRTLEDMEITDLVAFRKAVLAGVSCLKLSSSIWLDTPEGASYSKYVVQDLLRRHIGYSGLIVGNCVDMPAYINHRDVSRAAVDAISTGCDMIMMLNNIDSQVAAIRGLTDAVERGLLPEKDVQEKFERVHALKSNILDWRSALEPNPSIIHEMMAEHHVLAKKVHDGAVTIVRDDLGLIPVNLKISPVDTVLLITPTVRPLHRPPPGERLMDPFEPLGRALARRHPRIRHIPYTVLGMTPLHQSLIRSSAAVVFVTVNALQSQSQAYQLKMADAVRQACGAKPMIAVAACDPYDLLIDRHNFGTYLCTYEYSFMALETAAAVIMGERHAPGVLPVTTPGIPSRRQQRQWYVEKWEKRKDLYASLDLWKDCLGTERWPMDASTLSQLLDRPGCAQHYVVRNPNPSSNELLGLAVTYSINQAYTATTTVLGSLALLLVRPSHRNLGIGRSLHEVAIKYLANTPGMLSIQLGSIYPRIFPGLPVEMTQQDSMWFMRQGWKFDEKFVFDLFMNIQDWQPQTHVFTDQANKGIQFSACAPQQFDALIDFAIKNFGEYPGWVDRYRLLKNTDDIADAIVATNKETGHIVGAALVYTPASNNQMAKDIPWPKMIGERNGGFSCVSVGKDFRGQGLGTALICAAIVELKNRGIKGCFVDWVDVIEYEGTYKSLGFTHWGKYREIWRRTSS